MTPTTEKNDQQDQLKWEGGPALYERFGQRALWVKSALQMLIGVVGVGWILVTSFNSFASYPYPAPTPKDGEPPQTFDAVLFQGIGIVLAAAAVVELAYTLYTPGPDEALNPLMLGLSAILILRLADLGDLTWSSGFGAFLLVAALGLLFAIRVFLADSEEKHGPNVWWIRDRTKRDGSG